MSIPTPAAPATGPSSTSPTSPPHKANKAERIRRYVDGGRLPWTEGYSDVKWDTVERSIGDPELLRRMLDGASLPQGYGEFLDERVVEYPWLLSRLASLPENSALLDAGSILNFDRFVNHDAVQRLHLSILTLAPEKGRCFYERGISYLYADLRNMPLRDGWFDAVACVSTLEHVGMDNTLIYTADTRFREEAKESYLGAVREFSRVLKPGGRCFITVPFGRAQNDKFQQQFDRVMVDRVIEAFAPSDVDLRFFRYHQGQWDWSTADACADCEYFNIHATRHVDPASDRDYDPDRAAAARAVAAMVLTKPALYPSGNGSLGDRVRRFRERLRRR